MIIVLVQRNNIVKKKCYGLLSKLTSTADWSDNCHYTSTKSDNTRLIFSLDFPIYVKCLSERVKKKAAIRIL